MEREEWKRQAKKERIELCRILAQISSLAWFCFLVDENEIPGLYNKNKKNKK